MILRSSLALVAVLSAAFFSQQPTTTYPPVVHLTAEQDHQRTLDLLHISSLRRGPDADPKSPAANVDESKVRTYSLPHPLLLKNAPKATPPQRCPTPRRPQLLYHLHRDI